MVYKLELCKMIFFFALLFSHMTRSALKACLPPPAFVLFWNRHLLYRLLWFAWIQYYTASFVSQPWHSWNPNYDKKFKTVEWSVLSKQFRGKLSAEFKNIKTRKQPWRLNTIACCYVKTSIRKTKKKPPATISVISTDLLHLKKEVDREKAPGERSRYIWKFTYSDVNLVDVLFYDITFWGKKKDLLNEILRVSLGRIS